MDTEMTHIPSERLEAQLQQMSTRMAASMCEWLLLVAEFDRRELYRQWEALSAAHWLNWQCGIALGAGREHVRVARALLGLPAVLAAFAAGQLSYSKVRAITRVGTAANEAELVQVALTKTAAQVERIVRAYRRTEDAARSNEESQLEHRGIRYRWLDDGSLEMVARAPAEVGVLLLRALREATRVPAETSDTPTQRRVDALERILRAYLDAPGEADRGSGTMVVVHSTADGAHLHDGPSISNAAAERLACDCTLVNAATGAATRVVPPAMRRALDVRDEHQCQFPGCTNQGWLDAHHRRYWTNGGPTRLDNLILLCRHHHRAVHERGWSIGPDRTFYDPYGRPARVTRLNTALVS